MAFPPDMKALLDGLDIAPLPELADPEIPIDLNLVHAEGLPVLHPADVVRDLGQFKVKLETISLPGIGLDPQRGTLTVDLARIVPNLTLELGDLDLRDVNVELDADVALKEVASQPSFTSHMTALSAMQAAKIAVADKPSVGALLEIDSGLSAELRTVSSVSGSGPYEVTLALPLVLAHVIGTSVTEVSTLRPADVRTDEVTTPRSVPYAHNLGSRILGQVGKVTGSLNRVRATLKQAQDALGTIGGAIGPQSGAATIRLPGVKQIGDTAGHVVASLTHTLSSVANALPPGAEVGVEWQIRDEHGKLLTQYPDVLVIKGALDGPLGGMVSPSVAFLPPFRDLGDDETPAVRLISCKLTLTLDGTTYDETRGPVTVRVPKLPVPTVLAMTEHSIGADDFPGAVLLVVPPRYEIANLDVLKPPLEAIDRLVKALRIAFPNLPQPLLDLGYGVGLVLDLLSLGGQVTELRRTEVLDLWWETRAPGWPNNWQDVISSIVLVGLPGRTVSCHNRPNLWSGTGAFRLSTGSVPVAVLKSLWFRTESEAEVVPAGSRVTVDTLPERHFNDVISSFQLQ